MTEYEEAEQRGRDDQTPGRPRLGNGNLAKPYVVPPNAAREAYGGSPETEVIMATMHPPKALATPATDALVAEVRWKIRRRRLWATLGGDYVERALAFCRYKFRQILAKFVKKD